MPAPPMVPAVGTNPAAARGKAGGGGEVVRAHDEVTEPRYTPVPAALEAPRPRATTSPPDDGHGAILGIGTGTIGGRDGAVAGEIPIKVAPGQRVLVPGPNGLMQSATVRQLLQGYYELEVGSSGQTIWVPINGVVPE
jgi:hypothetical protein